MLKNCFEPYNTFSLGHDAYKTNEFKGVTFNLFWNKNVIYN